MKDVMGCAGVFILVVFLLAVGYAMGWGHSRDYHRAEFRREAIEAGAGEWQVDKDGRPFFVFRNPSTWHSQEE